jgi:hypothetical protein
MVSRERDANNEMKKKKIIVFDYLIFMENKLNYNIIFIFTVVSPVRTTHKPLISGRDLAHLNIWIFGLWARDFVHDERFQNRLIGNIKKLMIYASTENLSLNQL